MLDHTGDELSPAAAGCYLLLWQQPTDRALAGWAPWGGISHREDRPEDVNWMAGLLRASLGERSSLGGPRERAGQRERNRAWRH